MTELSSTPVPATPAAKTNRLTTLQLIAIFKLAKALVLLVIGFSLVVLHLRQAWLDRLIDWTDDELMLVHSHIAKILMEKFENALLGEHLRTTGVLALIYGAVLTVEGLGVYFKKRWAEYLMIVATASLIPLEVYHFIHKPSVVKVIVILLNVAVVGYLFYTLRKHHD
jgi:uncharacterized membrane protein (DUF2068 family)